MSLLGTATKSSSKREGYTEIPDTEETNSLALDGHSIYGDKQGGKERFLSLQKVIVFTLFIVMVALGSTVVGVVLYRKSEHHTHFSLPAGQLQ